MAEVEWAQLTDDEVIASVAKAPRIFGPWREWPELYGGPRYAWSRDEVFPGPSWKSGGSVVVMRHTGCPGYGVSWWDGHEERHAGNFATAEEAMAYGDAWLAGAGCRAALADAKDGS